MKSRILYTKPSITELEVRYATDAAANGWGDKCYEYINKFEDLFKQHLGVQYAIATSSCTGALHMGIAALGIGPGDEVIMADTNWIATASPIVNLGAKPVFVDILSDSWCIDPAKAEAAITTKTKAIVAVHLYGNLCDMDRLLAIGEKYGIPVIEDAAHALGTTYAGKKTGNHFPFTVFSFQAIKHLTTIDGGALQIQDKELYEKGKLIRWFGLDKKLTRLENDIQIQGYKYHMNNVNATIGLVQLETIEELLQQYRTIGKYLDVNLNGLPGLETVVHYPNSESSYWLYTLKVDRRDDFVKMMAVNGFMASEIHKRNDLHTFSTQHEESTRCI
jgi:perosamine synthetase